MKHQKLLQLAIIGISSLFCSCEKWQDKPAKDLGLTNKYCNIPSAINYNYGFPGIVDNSTCILPSTPFIGTFSFQDSVYDNTDQLFVGPLLSLTVVANDSTHFAISGLCSNGNQIKFTANKYYQAVTDSIIGQGSQLFCRDLDTVLGKLEYFGFDSSLLVQLTVISDTSIVTHKGKAYKK